MGTIIKLLKNIIWNMLCMSTVVNLEFIHKKKTRN